MRCAKRKETDNRGEEEAAGRRPLRRLLHLGRCMRVSIIYMNHETIGRSKDFRVLSVEAYSKVTGGGRRWREGSVHRQVKL